MPKPVPFAEVQGLARGAESGTTVTADAEGRFVIPNPSGRPLATVSADAPNRSMHAERGLTGKGPVVLIAASIAPWRPIGLVGRTDTSFQGVMVRAAVRC